LATASKSLIFLDLRNFSLVVTARHRQRLKLVGRFVLGAFEVVDRTVELIVLSIHAAVCVVEPRYANRLLARVLWLLCSVHVNLATHLDTIV